MEQGAPPEEALAILDRINRLDVSAPPLALEPATARPASSVPAARASRAAWALLIVLSAVIVAAAAFAAGAFRGDVALLVRPAPSVAALPLPPGEGPALPRRGENALSRGRQLAQSGRWREALAVLATVRVTDPQKADADRLRADLQKQLIAMSAGAAVSPAVGSVSAP